MLFLQNPSHFRPPYGTRSLQAYRTPLLVYPSHIQKRKVFFDYFPSIFFIIYDVFDTTISSCIRSLEIYFSSFIFQHKKKGAGDRCFAPLRLGNALCHASHVAAIADIMNCTFSSSSLTLRVVLCTARLGLKAAALAWLCKTSGQAKAAAHGLAPAWLGPGRGFCM